MKVNLGTVITKKLQDFDSTVLMSAVNQIESTTLIDVYILVFRNSIGDGIRMIGRSINH